MLWNCWAIVDLEGFSISSVDFHVVYGTVRSGGGGIIRGLGAESPGLGAGVLGGGSLR